MAIIKDRELLSEDGSIPMKLLTNCINEHVRQVNRYNKLYKYYKGEHDVLNRSMQGENLPNNKLVCNHAAYITDMATSYVIGNPVSYKEKDDNEESLEAIKDIFNSIDIHSHDTELSKDISIYGLGLELLYMSSDEVPIPKVTSIDPNNIFLVVDDTVEYKSMFAVNYYPKYDLDNKLTGYIVNVYTEDEIIKYKFKDLNDTKPEELEREAHAFNGVPVIEYWNNKIQQGDFEQVITLIDAYNILQSDRVNDKEQLVDAILAIYGASLGDDDDEVTETAKALKRHKLLELPVDGKAEWLIKQLNETEVEVLKKAIKDDIHEFSKVPCLTDENFASQASGVAMKYKLLGLEQLGKTKESYFKQGLRERLNLLSNILNIKVNSINPSNIEIVMTRSLPANEFEIANMINNLGDVVSLETRLSLLPFISDPKEEVKKVKEEEQERLKTQQKAFGYGYDDKDFIGDDKGNNKEDIKPKDKKEDGKVNE